MAKWNFEELLQRLQAIKGTGLPDDLEERVPGLAAILRQVDFRVEELEPIEKILRAMTREERLHPELLEDEPGLPNRERVARDSGTSLDEVEALISQFRTLCEMLESMSPEEVTQELMGDLPKLEPWQESADAWKSDVAPEDAEPDPEEAAARERRALDARVDDLLRRIAGGGMEALTPDERVFLDEASRRYRER